LLTRNIDCAFKKIACPSLSCLVLVDALLMGNLLANFLASHYRDGGPHKKWALEMRFSVMRRLGRPEAAVVA
jgi:hypothetical protein